MPEGRWEWLHAGTALEVLACFMMYVRTCERLDGCVALVISVPFVYIMPLARAGVLYILLHPYLGPSFPSCHELQCRQLETAI